MVVTSRSYLWELFGSGFNMQSWTLAGRLSWKVNAHAKERRVWGVKDSLLCQKERCREKSEKFSKTVGVTSVTGPVSLGPCIPNPVQLVCPRHRSL